MGRKSSRPTGTEAEIRCDGLATRRVVHFTPSVHTYIIVILTQNRMSLRQVMRARGQPMALLQSCRRKAVDERAAKVSLHILLIMISIRGETSAQSDALEL